MQTPADVQAAPRAARRLDLRGLPLAAGVRFLVRQAAPRLQCAAGATADMPRTVKAALAAAAVAALAAASAARAQTFAATDAAIGRPAGLALPAFGAAAAEEPTALGTNPAGVRFVDRLALQYFHEAEATRDGKGDGLYLANSFGPLGLGYSTEWLRPGEGAVRYRRTRLGVALGDGRAFSLGAAWTWIASPDAALDRQGGWDLGLTVRPGRRLSIGAAMLDRDAGPGRPVRYDFGLATRLLDDGLTLSADLLASDQARDAFRAEQVALGAQLETRLGLALGAQVQFPVRDLPAAPGATRAYAHDVTGVFSLSWNGGHAGFTGGAVQVGGDTGWFTGARLSGERYRTAGFGEDVPTVDVQEELERGRTLFLDLGERDPYGALLRRLERARDDRDVAGLVVRISGSSLGAGRTEELRAALAAVAARKPVIAYLTGGDTRGYWLATGATVVAVAPGSALLVNGVSTSQLYLRTALARLGIGFEVVKAGAYKSATEPLVQDAPSPEAKEALDALLDDVFGKFVADVSAARKLAPERVRALVDEGLFTAEGAEKAGLVDAVLWPDQLEGLLRKLSGRPLHEGGRYVPEPDRVAQRFGLPPVVQVIRVEGTIVPGPSRRPFGTDGIAGAETLAKAIARAADDGRVKAIVLRIESPGGDGEASARIWREAVRARTRGKPVIASLGDVAASGGYLVAVGADAIVAEPTTITGSIGVFAVKPDLSGLLGKLAVHREASVRGKNAELTALGRPWSASERAVLERQIRAFYADFLDKVAEGRRMPRAEVEPLAGGRVWTGRQAHERRLVDRLGSLGDAIALARQRAGLPADDWVEIRSEDGRGALSRLGADVAEEALARDPLVRALAGLPELTALALLSEMGPVLALPEEWLPARVP